MSSESQHIREKTKEYTKIKIDTGQLRFNPSLELIIKLVTYYNSDIHWGVNIAIENEGEAIYLPKTTEDIARETYSSLVERCTKEYESMQIEIKHKKPYNKRIKIYFKG